MKQTLRQMWKRALHVTWTWTGAHPLVMDGALALGIFGLAVLSSSAQIDFFTMADPRFDAPSKAAQLAGLALTVAPLAFRRKTPLLALVACTVGFVASRVVLEWGLEPTVTGIAFSIAVFSAAAHGRRIWRNAVCGVSALVVVIEIFTELDRIYTDQIPHYRVLEGTALLVYVALFCAMWALGVALGSGRRRAAELLERTRALEQQREENARRAVFEERVRIARELHDVVAHHVSLMGIQATAARLTMDRDPTKAAAALESIESSSRQALTELHRLLGFLRQAGDPDDRAARPGLDRLGDLVKSVTSSSFAVEVSIEGTPRTLPTSVDVSAYRIVQEALTNTRKHARASRASVRLCYRDVDLQVDVLDDGRGSSDTAGNGRAGLGLVGMRERAALLGGRLSAGPVATGGFLVRVTLPTSAGVL